METASWHFVNLHNFVIKLNKSKYEIHVIVNKSTLFTQRFPSLVHYSIRNRLITILHMIKFQRLHTFNANFPFRSYSVISINRKWAFQFLSIKWIKAHFQCSLLQGTSLTDNQTKKKYSKLPVIANTPSLHCVHAKLKRNNFIFQTIENSVEILVSRIIFQFFHLSDGVKWTVIVK